MLIEAEWYMRRGSDALDLAGPDEITALTRAATESTFYTDRLSAAEVAAIEAVVDMSAPVCLAAGASAHQHFAAAFDESGIAGFMVATRHSQTSLELDWMMLHPRGQGTGVAGALMEEGLDWLGPDNPIWLNVIRHNGRAIRFYRKFGFEIDPDTTTGHVIPHWVMRRSPGA